MSDNAKPEGGAAPAEAKEPQGGGTNQQAPQTKEPAKASAGGVDETQKGGTGASAKPEAVASKPPKTVKPDEDDDLPEADEKGNVTLPMTQFLRRAGRMARKDLRRIFGTDDLEKIAETHKTLLQVQKDKDERDKKELSEAERWKKEAEDAKKALEAERVSSARREEKVAVRTFERDVASVASDLFAEDTADDALDRLARAIRKDEVTTLGGAKKFLRGLVKEKPHWAKAKVEVESDKGDKPKPEVKRVPINNGAGGGKPASQKPGTGGAKRYDSKSGISKEEILRDTGYKIT